MEMAVRTVSCKRLHWKLEFFFFAIWLSIHASVGQVSIASWTRMNTFQPFCRMNHLPSNSMATLWRKSSCLAKPYLHIIILFALLGENKANDMSFNQKTCTKANRLVGIPWQPRGLLDVLPIGSCPLVWFTIYLLYIMRLHLPPCPFGAQNVLPSARTAWMIAPPVLRSSCSPQILGFKLLS